MNFSIADASSAHSNIIITIITTIIITTTMTVIW